MQQNPTNGILEEFRISFQEAAEKLPNKGIFLILLVAWVALFQFLGNSTLGYINSPSLFRWTLDAYHPSGNFTESEDAHGLIVPFVVLVLFWLKREELLSLKLRMWWPGLGLLLLALGLHVCGYMIQQPRLSLIAMFSGIYALMALTWGPGWMVRSFFPFVLFAFCIPLGAFGQVITMPLRHLVAIIVTGIAHLGLAPDLVREGTQLYDAQHAFSYDIAPACSGIRSLASLLALTTIFGYISFKSGWKRLLVVLSAFPLAIIGNVTRITCTVVVSEVFGQEAGSSVEQKLGFVTFAIAIVAILLLEHWLRKRYPEAQLPLQPKPT